MYHPFEPGVFWQESHWPEVRIYRKQKFVEIRIHVTPALKQQLEIHFQHEWTYIQCATPSGYVYTFVLRSGYAEQNITEIRALDRLLGSIAYFGGNEEYTTPTSDSATAQIAFVEAGWPAADDIRPGMYGLWVKFSSLGTTYLQTIASSHVLEEYVSSRMRGLYKILHSVTRSLRHNVLMYVRKDGTPLPGFRTVGSCACLGVENREIDSHGGFQLSSHNVDASSQQCVLLVGVLVLWQRMRQARLRQDPTIDALPAMPET
jgi:hypothetical protein